MNSTAAWWLVSSTRPHGVLGQPGLGQAVAQHGDDGPVGLDGCRRAPQERGVARLQAQPGGVAGDVGPVLVDDADDPERDPHPGGSAARWAAPIRRPPRRRGRAVRPRREAVGHAAIRSPVRRSRSTGGGVRTASAAASHVDAVGLEQLAGPPLEEVRGAQRRASSPYGATTLERPPGRPPGRARTELGQGGRGVGGHRTSYRSRPVALSPDDRHSAKNHQVVTVYDLVGRSSGSSAVRRPAHVSTRDEGWRTSPLAKTAPSGPTISTASSGPNGPRTDDHAGREQRAPRFDQRPPRPVVDDHRSRRRRWRTRSTACGPEAGAPGPEHRPDPGSPGRRLPGRRDGPPRRSPPPPPTRSRSWRRPAWRPCLRCRSAIPAPRRCARARGRSRPPLR